MRFAYRGGNSNNTVANCGAFYVNLNNTASNYFKAVRKARRIKNKGLNIYTARQMLSYMGWFKCTDCYGAYLKHIKPNVTFRSLRHYVSRWDKKHKKEFNYGLV